jgi:murein DD-endopeptidase MepM/ murein hydrolase activator NlpD
VRTVRGRGTHARRLAVAVLATALVLPFGAAASAQTTDELERELDDTTSQAEELDSELEQRRALADEAEEELAAVGARLEDARGRLRAAEGQLALAEAARDESERERVAAVEAAERAAAELHETEVELGMHEAALADQAVAAYKFGSVGGRAGSAAFDVARRAEDPNEFAVGMHTIGRVIGHQGTTVELVTELRDEHRDRSRAAEEAQALAAQAAADAAEQVRFTDRLREEAATLTSQIADEESEQAALAARLEDEAATTAASLERVAARQQELADELSDRRAAEEAARLAAEAERRAQARDAGTAGRAGGPSVDGVCPVAGAVAGRDFSNDWGYPRSGGRTHQGNDIFAARGAAIVAIADATVVRVNASDSGLGGLTITYRTADGSEWYNAHLDTIAPGMEPGVSVAQGDEVGTVGNTGNARTTPPHNHIGRKHDGSWVNPWPTISPLCR